MLGPVSELKRAPNISIMLEIMEFESREDDEDYDDARTAIKIAAPVCHLGSTETPQMMNGVPRSALSGEHSLR
jgi:hypothetical protein